LLDGDSYDQIGKTRVNEFSGISVLVVEDEGGIALLIEDMLEELGCNVVASVAHLAEATEIARTVSADLALLDVNLDGKLVFPVARILLDRGVPVVFSTGYGTGGLPPEFAGCPVIGKTFTVEDLRSAVSVALTRTAARQGDLGKRVVITPVVKTSPKQA
jgi:CheY-like chemotaxis protein